MKQRSDTCPQFADPAHPGFIPGRGAVLVPVCVKLRDPGFRPSRERTQRAGVQVCLLGKDRKLCTPLRPVHHPHPLFCVSRLCWHLLTRHSAVRSVTSHGETWSKRGMNPFLLAAPWLAFPLIVPFILRRRPRLRDFAPAATQLPFVSVIVPARNEAINIDPCVGSLLESDYPHKEIIVVDDGSTDATGDIAHAMAESDANLLRVIEPEPLPANWIGKCWACWNGYQQARGDLLLFTDADTRHLAELLPRAVAALEQSGAGLLTILPRQLMESFWERVVLPHVFLAITMRFARAAAVNRTHNPRDAIANGQFLLMTRSTYERIGTHQAVRASVVDDLAIAQRVVEVGDQLLVVHAPEYLQTRMYRSLPEIIEGWSKNLALGAQLAFPRFIATLLPWLAVLLGIVLWVAPPLLLLATFFLTEIASLRAWAFIATLAALAGWVYVNLHMRAGLSSAFLYPLGALVTAYLMARSAWRGHRVEWRGRSYRVEI